MLAVHDARVSRAYMGRNTGLWSTCFILIAHSVGLLGSRAAFVGRLFLLQPQRFSTICVVQRLDQG